MKDVLEDIEDASAMENEHERFRRISDIFKTRREELEAEGWDVDEVQAAFDEEHVELLKEEEGTIRGHTPEEKQALLNREIEDPIMRGVRSLGKGVRNVVQGTAEGVPELAKTVAWDAPLAAAGELIESTTGFPREFVPGPIKAPGNDAIRKALFVPAEMLGAPLATVRAMRDEGKPFMEGIAELGTMALGARSMKPGRAVERVRPPQPQYPWSRDLAEARLDARPWRPGMDTAAKSIPPLSRPGAPPPAPPPAAAPGLPPGAALGPFQPAPPAPKSTATPSPQTPAFDPHAVTGTAETWAQMPLVDAAEAVGTGRVGKPPRGRDTPGDPDRFDFDNVHLIKPEAPAKTPTDRKLREAGNMGKLLGYQIVPPWAVDLFEKSGLRRETMRAAAAESRLKRTYEQRMGGPEFEASVETFFQENPVAWDIPRKLRENVALSPEEAQFHAQHGSKYQPYLDETFRFLDEVRTQAAGMGIEMGNLGPTYYPHVVSTMGEIIQYLGKNWRQKLKSKSVRDTLIKHLDIARRGTKTLTGNPIPRLRAYREGIAHAQTMRPLLQDATAAMEKLRKKPGRGADADAVKEFIDSNIQDPGDVFDAQALEASMNDLASAPELKVGEVIPSTGQWFPGQGEIKITKGKNPRGEYEVTLDGRPMGAPISEVTLQAEKHGLSPAVARQGTGMVNGINRVASWLEVGGKLSSGVDAVLSNIARIVGHEGFADVKHGVRVLKDSTKKPTKALIDEWMDQGVMDSSLRAVTENPNATGVPGMVEKIYFSPVRLPDQWARIVAYEAAKARLARKFPDLLKSREGILELRNRASEWSTAINDAMGPGNVAPIQRKLLGKWLMFLQMPQIREAVRVGKNLSEGELAAAFKHVGIRAVTGGTLLAAAGGSVKDLGEMLVQYVPVIGAALSRGDTPGGAAIGIIGGKVGGAVSGALSEGEIPYSALPGSVKQVRDLYDGDPMRLLFRRTRRKARGGIAIPGLSE